MRYELSHDQIARQVNAKGSEEAHLRRKITTFVQNKYEQYLQQNTLLSADDLDYIRPLEAQIQWTDKQTDFIAASKAKVRWDRRKQLFIWITISLILLAATFIGFYLAAQEKNARLNATQAEIKAQSALLDLQIKQDSLEQSKRKLDISNNQVLEQNDLLKQQRLDLQQALRNITDAKERARRNADFSNAQRFAFLAREQNDLGHIDHAQILAQQAWQTAAYPKPATAYSNMINIWPQRSDSWIYASAPLQHNDWVDEMHFSESGNLLLTTEQRGPARIWNLKGQLLTTLNDSENARQLRFTDKDKTILGINGNRQLHKWNLQGKIIKTVLDSVADFRLMPNGAIIYIHRDGRLYHFQNGKKKLLAAETYRQLFTFDEMPVCIAAGYEQIKIWDQDGKQQTEIPRDYSSIVQQSADQQYLLFETLEYQTALWDTKEQTYPLILDKKSDTIPTIYPFLDPTRPLLHMLVPEKGRAVSYDYRSDVSIEFDKSNDYGALDIREIKNGFLTLFKDEAYLMDIELDEQSFAAQQPLYSMKVTRLHPADEKFEAPWFEKFKDQVDIAQAPNDRYLTFLGKNKQYYVVDLQRQQLVYHLSREWLQPPLPRNDLQGVYPPLIHTIAANDHIAIRSGSRVLLYRTAPPLIHLGQIKDKTRLGGYHLSGNGNYVLIQNGENWIIYDTRLRRVQNTPPDEAISYVRYEDRQGKKMLDWFPDIRNKKSIQIDTEMGRGRYRSDVHLAYANDFPYLIFAADKEFQIWDQKGALIRRFEKEDRFIEVHRPLKGDLFAYLNQFSREVVFENIEGNQSFRLSHDNIIVQFQLSQNGKYAMCVDLENAIHIWDVQKRQKIHTYQLNEQIYNTAISENGQYAMAKTKGELHLWDNFSRSLIGKSVIKIEEEPYNEVLDFLTFLPGQDQFLAYDGQLVRHFDLPKGIDQFLQTKPIAAPTEEQKRIFQFQ